jgi:hypothetical protein
MVSFKRRLLTTSLFMGGLLATLPAVAAGSTGLGTTVHGGAGLTYKF